MTRDEFNKKMEQAHACVLSMPKETDSQRFYRGIAMENLQWAEFAVWGIVYREEHKK